MVDGFDDCDLLDLRRVVRSPAPSVDCLLQEALYDGVIAVSRCEFVRYFK